MNIKNVDEEAQKIGYDSYKDFLIKNCQLGTTACSKKINLSRSTHCHYIKKYKIKVRDKKKESLKLKLKSLGYKNINKYFKDNYYKKTNIDMSTELGISLRAVVIGCKKISLTKKPIINNRKKIYKYIDICENRAISLGSPNLVSYLKTNLDKKNKKTIMQELGIKYHILIGLMSYYGISNKGKETKPVHETQRTTTTYHQVKKDRIKESALKHKIQMDNCYIYEEKSKPNEKLYAQTLLRGMTDAVR